MSRPNDLLKLFWSYPDNVGQAAANKFGRAGHQWKKNRFRLTECHETDHEDRFTH